MARMNHEEFLNKMQEKFDLCMKEARAKNPDYASHGKEGASGLNNFYETAEESGVTPLQAWHTHYYKHYLAIRQAVRGKELRSETLAGRFKDAAVYNIIGWLLVEEMEAEKAIREETYNKSESRFISYCYAPGVWVVKDLNYDLYLMYPAEKPAYTQCRGFNNSPITAAGLDWLTVSQLEERIDENRGHRSVAVENEKKPYHGMFPPPLPVLSNHTEPRFHTAKDTQIDTKSPDGTSEHWYIIDTVGKRRVRVYSNERLTAADRAAIECRNFNNGTNPDILTSWEPFPAT